MSAGRIPTTANSPLTTKGDLFTYSTSPARLAVGSNGETLVADSSTATGLKYQAPTVNTVIDAKGDLLAGTAADTIARLAVGANNTVLTADSSTATGLKWATPTSGAYTLLTSGTLSGASVSLTSISQSYQDLQLIMTNVVPATSGEGIVLQVNSGANNYFYATVNANGTWSTTNNTDILMTSGQGTSQQFATINISNYTSTAASAFMSWGWTNDTSHFKRNYIGFIRAGAAITSIQMKVQDATNYTSGNYYLYGIK